MLAKTSRFYSRTVVVMSSILRTNANTSGYVDDRNGALHRMHCPKRPEICSNCLLVPRIAFRAAEKMVEHGKWSLTEIELRYLPVHETE